MQTAHISNVMWMIAECHTETTTTTHFTKIFPLGLWSKEPGGHHNSLTLYMRGTGVATITLTKLPGMATSREPLKITWPLTIRRACCFYLIQMSAQQNVGCIFFFTFTGTGEITSTWCLSNTVNTVIIFWNSLFQSVSNHKRPQCRLDYSALALPSSSSCTHNIVLYH